MEKIISLINKLMIFISIFSFGLLGYTLWGLSQEEIQSSVSSKELTWYCGSMDLPSNKVYILDHPGLALYNSNCKTCHSLNKDEIVVGPSLYGTSKKVNPELFHTLLYNDPKNKLIKTKFYKDLKSNFNGGFHKDYKFKLNELERKKLRSFIDTITIIQS